MRRLSNEQIEWIIKAKVNGKFTNKEIADVQGISISRVQQLYREYKSTGVIHVQKRAGRHKQPLPKLNMKSLSFTKCTEPMRAISAKFSERKDTALTTTGSTKYSKRPVLQ